MKKYSKKKWSVLILIIILVIGILLVIIFSSAVPIEGVGWSNKCQVSSDCAFIEKVNVPVPGPEGCYSITENPVIQRSQNLISDRKECECINNICQVKTA
jgi:hypothetical protein